ncbi:MAG TPA: short-chain dehydrogenase [Microscillaceae bacterium]|nr:short-chain dehydrogenase [Microscillaceae bacterium]
MNISLAQKKAIVCGSSQGIGKATAMALAQLGAEVTLIARNPARIQTVLELLDTSQGQQHRYILADFSKPDQLQQKLNQYLATFPQCHILVNNSGGPAPSGLLEAELEDFRNGFEQHLICSQMLVQAFAPMMKQAGYGRIINIISTSVKEPLANLGVSGTIRWAVAGWAKALANELGPDNITVNNVLPGFTATERLTELFENNSRRTGKSVEVLQEEAKQQIPLRRFAQPEEIAQAIAFLATPAAAYINGTNLVVDGGRTKSL